MIGGSWWVKCDGCACRSRVYKSFRLQLHEPVPYVPFPAGWVHMNGKALCGNCRHAEIQRQLKADRAMRPPVFNGIYDPLVAS